MSMMMSCQQYLFVLTSGQLEEAGWLTRAQAGQHRLMCRRCRTFTRNDAMLDQLTMAWRDRLLGPNQSGEASTAGDDRTLPSDQDTGSGKL